MKLFILIFIAVAIYIVYILLFKIAPNVSPQNTTPNDEDLIREKAIRVADLMQQVIDEVKHCLTNVPTGGLGCSYDRFKKELSELQKMVSETSVNVNLTVRIDDENVPLRNIIVGAQLFGAELKRNFPTL